MQDKKTSAHNSTAYTGTDQMAPRADRYGVKATCLMLADAVRTNTRRVTGRTAALAIAVAMTGTIPIAPAQATPIEIHPGDVYSNVPEVSGVVGDGTVGNDSWHVTTGSAHTYDFFYLGDLLGITNNGVTIRDIVRMSFDVQRSGSYADDTFTMQIETNSLNQPGGTKAIDFLINQRGDTSVDDSGDFLFGEWNTYEWNQAGNAATGLEGTIHQNETAPSAGNGGNGKNNPWLTLRETLDRDAQYQGDGDLANDDYYSWLDESIDGLKIAARDESNTEFEGWIDNFTVTYNSGNGEQMAVIDFAAENVAVPEPATLGMALFGLALLGMGLGARRYYPRA